MLLDRMFTLAKERGLDLDFHVDENPNIDAKGLRYVALKTIEHGYQGHVVCGHCWCDVPSSNIHPARLVAHPPTKQPTHKDMNSTFCGPAER